jgi:hypothetical protein
MAKGQVTTDDLATGIKSFGGLSSLGGAPRAVRDNPFRDTRSEPSVPAIVAQPEPAAEPPRLEVITAHELSGAGEGVKVAVAPKPVREKRPTPPRSTSSQAPAPIAGGESGPMTREKKTEVYPEQVSVMLNAEMRDRAEALAKELQRRRTQKTERITTNTVIRVALRALLDRFDPAAAAGLNTESDLYEAVLRQWSDR